MIAELIGINRISKVVFKSHQRRLSLKEFVRNRINEAILVTGVETTLFGQNQRPSKGA